MLFTHLQKIEKSFSEEIDFNKLSDYENLILIAINEQNTHLKIFCGGDKKNLYAIFDNKEVRKEIADLFNNYNYLNKEINPENNFIIYVSLESHFLTSHETNATVIDVNSAKEVLNVLEDFQRQNSIHDTFKKISINVLKNLWKLVQKSIK